MKNRLYHYIAAVAGAAIVASGIAIPAFAQTLALGLGVNASATVTIGNGNASIGAGTSVQANIISNAQQRADREITRRIDAMTALITRINAMVKVSSSSKTALSSEIQSQITAMNTLQAQITADAAANSTSSLKTDIKSITKSYRIFALIIPQGALDAAADRVLDVADMFTTLAGQLQTRITAAQNAGADMSASISALADMNAKVSDANTQANAATAAIANLQPDNGDQATMAVNASALKAARTKIQAAQQDLVAARKDAGTIVKALASLKTSANASTTVTATTTADH